MNIYIYILYYQIICNQFIYISIPAPRGGAGRAGGGRAGGCNSLRARRPKAAPQSPAGRPPRWEPRIAARPLPRAGRTGPARAAAVACRPTIGGGGGGKRGQGPPARHRRSGRGPGRAGPGRAGPPNVA